MESCSDLQPIIYFWHKSFQHGSNLMNNNKLLKKFQLIAIDYSKILDYKGGYVDSICKIDFSRTTRTK